MTKLMSLAKNCLHWKMNETIFPVPPATNITACHLTAGIYAYEIVKSIFNASFICSMHNDILRMILENLLCSLSFRISKDSFPGQKINGVWNGIMGMLARKEADFLPYRFYAAAANHRTEVSHFEFLMPSKGIVTMISYPQYSLRQSVGQVFAIFSVEIWLYTGAALLCCSLLDWINCRKMQKQQQRRVASLAAYLQLHWEKWFALVIGQGTASLRDAIAFRTVVIAFAFGTLILRQLFSGDITATLVSMKQLKFDYFAQLEEETDTQIMVENGSNSYMHFMELFPQLKTRVIIVSNPERNSPVILRKLIYEKSVLIATGRIARYLSMEYPQVDFHLSEQNYLLSLSNYPIRKGLQPRAWRAKLSKLFKSVFQFGLFTRVGQPIKMSAFRPKARMSTSIDTVHVMTSLNLTFDTQEAYEEKQRHDRLVETMMSYLYIYMTGIVASFVLFCQELISGIVTRLSKDDRNTSDEAPEKPKNLSQQASNSDGGTNIAIKDTQVNNAGHSSRPQTAHIQHKPTKAAGIHYSQYTPQQTATRQQNLATTREEAWKPSE